MKNIFFIIIFHFKNVNTFNICECVCWGTTNIWCDSKVNNFILHYKFLFLSFLSFPDKRILLLEYGGPLCSFSLSKNSVQFSLVTQSCPTLCDPMNHSTPGLPVHHQLPELTPRISQGLFTFWCRVSRGSIEECKACWILGLEGVQRHFHDIHWSKQSWRSNDL